MEFRLISSLTEYLFSCVNVGTESRNGNGVHSVAENKLGNGDLIFAQTDVDISKSITAEPNYQSHKNLKDEEHSGLHLLHSGNSSKSETASSRSVENQYLRALPESKNDWDVERVIEEQDTHDLYCPKCNSCITKRVILRKRKRRIHSLQDDSKREKLEVAQSSSFARSEQEHNTASPDLNGSPPSVDITDQDRETGPDIFRCLSCFSFFIPSVAAFKSFRMFKDRSDSSENVQNPEQIPAKTGSVNQDDKSATFSSLLLVDSDAHEQVNISTSQISMEEQSSQVSIHRVETRIDTRRNDGNKKIEGGYDVIQDQSISESSNSLAYMDKTLSYENNASMSSASGAQHPAISDTTHEDSKLFHLKEGENISIMTKHETFLSLDKCIGMENKLEGLPMGTDAGKDVILVIGADKAEVLQGVQTNINSSTPVTLTYRELESGDARPADEAGISGNWDIMKSIVYGGLVESIASLGLVSSAAGGDANTLNIVALGLASVIGGLSIIAHGLMDLKKEQYGGATNPNGMIDRYQEVLGRRANFRLHSTVAVLSYLIFGLVAPITYGFSFRKSDNKEYKLIAVAAASLVCITLLAIAKAYVRKPPKAYIKTVLYFVSIGVMSSGLSYVIGQLIKELLDKLGWFEPIVIDPVPPPSFYEQMAVKSSWGSF
ncbi:membrane protein of ER body-like protein [Thalictrum thalictroides]|uniref:Membrane protein of ER body-like protein n=1 Tax=Thalictrum thalictroides TaxID=46969 RepID=A0A7J6UYZ3_THATH|nr:membrane protein of ER body-like protein [Thalictrum thalictroides]